MSEDTSKLPTAKACLALLFALYLAVLVIGTMVSNIRDVDSPCHDDALRPIAVAQGARC